MLEDYNNLEHQTPTHRWLQLLQVAIACSFQWFLRYIATWSITVELMIIVWWRPFEIACFDLWLCELKLALLVLDSNLLYKPQTAANKLQACMHEACGRLERFSNQTCIQYHLTIIKYVCTTDSFPLQCSFVSIYPWLAYCGS